MRISGKQRIKNFEHKFYHELEKYLNMKKNRPFTEKFNYKQDITVLYNIIDFNNLRLQSDWSYTNQDISPFENAIA